MLLYCLWFDKLNARAAAKVATAPIRMVQGNLSDAKGVGAGVFEHRIDFGPRYRVYILPSGGTKKRQQKDIKTARLLWAEHKQHQLQKG